jgi:hypothetical protein
LDTTKTKGIVLSRPADSLSHGNPKISPTALAFAKDLYQSGQTKQTLGRVMSWAGLGGAVIGGIASQGMLLDVGLLSLLIGIPVNGSGTGDMIEAANQLNPEFHLEESGWWSYGLSWAAMAGGVGMIVSAMPTNYASGDQLDGTAKAGAIVYLAGMVGQGVAWAQFSSSADRAELSRKHSPYSLSVQPDFVATREGGLAPGMALALRF